MRPLLRVAVGVTATLGALRVAREIRDTHVPAGARSALGAVAHVTSVAQAVRKEFTAGVAEREAELRADLLAGADLTRSRALVEAWRAERAARSSGDAEDDRSRAASGTERDATGPDAGDPGTTRSGSTGAHTAGPGATAGQTATRTVRRSGSGAHRLEDPDDGPVGYSFF